MTYFSRLIHASESISLAACSTVICEVFQGLGQAPNFISADKIIFLNGDGTIDVGSTGKLLQRNEVFRRLYELDDTTMKRCEQNCSTRDDLKVDNSCLLSTFKVDQRSKTSQVMSFENNSAKTSEIDLGEIVAEEDVSVNPVSWNVYKEYIKWDRENLDTLPPRSV